MKLAFEKGSAGRKLDLISPYDVPQVSFEKTHIHEKQPRLPHLSENEISRHYTELAKCSHGVNGGFYPLSSCTVKYNPKVNEEAVALKGFKGVHPLQLEAVVQGSMEVLYLVEKYLCEITGMDAMTFQPAAGARGEFTGLSLIKAYHVHHNDAKRTKIIVPDSAHGTNSASTTMCGYDMVSIPSKEDGCVDLEQLKAAARDDTASLMLTNPNTMRLFDKSTLEITKIVHDAGGLCYYDRANLSVVTGIVRPGDMGFDVVHLNLYKTFSTPHGGGGPGSGPVGCEESLKPLIPGVRAEKGEDAYHFVKAQESTGDVKMFYGNFPMVVKILTYILTLGKEGIPEAARNAVLNADYIRVKLSDVYDMAYNETCVHELVMSLGKMEHDKDVNVMDITKALLDYGTHLSTMYFPLIVHEALMAEPTETEFKETLDEATEVFHRVYEQALADPEAPCSVPYLTSIGRPDKVIAAHKLVLCYTRG